MGELGRACVGVPFYGLQRGRPFRDKEELKKARGLIEQCGYWRRKEELEDAEQVIGG